MYKRILVPLDGSERAERILSHAETLAKQNESLVILLYVIEPMAAGFTPSMSMMVTPPPQEMELYWKGMQAAEDEGKKYLQKRSAEMEKKGLKVETVLLRGEPVNAIVNTAREKNADLVAMTSHGRTGLERVFYGSVTTGVLHKVDRPLLIIRALDK